MQETPYVIRFTFTLSKCQHIAHARGLSDNHFGIPEVLLPLRSTRMKPLTLLLPMPIKNPSRPVGPPDCLYPKPWVGEFQRSRQAKEDSGRSAPMLRPFYMHRPTGGIFERLFRRRLQFGVQGCVPPRVMQVALMAAFPVPVAWRRQEKQSQHLNSYPPRAASLKLWAEHPSSCHFCWRPWPPSTCLRTPSLT